MNIKDIAKLSGFSVATVSRVLNNPSSVSPKTREHIQAIMKENDYTPNSFARGLNKRPTRTIGILCSDINDINHSRIISILEHKLREKGYAALLCCTGEQAPYNITTLNLLAEKQVAAILIIGSLYDDTGIFPMIHDIAQHIPFIVLNGYINLPGVYNITCNEKRMLFDLVMDLFKQGCRHLYYLEDNNTYSAYQKRSGFMEGIKACGIESYCKCIHVPLDTKEVLNARKQMESVINKSYPVDAVLSADDALAVGALQALVNSGIQIPVIGFNNSDYAICCTPHLTSVDTRIEFICNSAIETMTSLFNGMEALDLVTISAKLIERETYKKQR